MTDVKNNDFKKGSIAVLVSAAVIFIVWDFVPFISRAVGDTLSELIQSGMYRYPAITFAWGFLNGHWIFRNEGYVMNNALTFSFIGVIVAFLVASIILQKHKPFILPVWSVLLLFSFGMICGHYVWGLDALKGTHT